MLESELFGHERGAFTGAINMHKGRFELADGGTLFLDEIGEITPAFQAKLLRVLQEGEFERVGGTRTIKVDVRLICATHRDLEEEVQNGKFRVDLYYRISVVPILLPPLRERKSDIALLANEFLNRFNREQGSHLTFSQSAIEFLSECTFPGNIRELENYVLRTATLAPGDVINDKDISCLNDNLSFAHSIDVTQGQRGQAPTIRAYAHSAKCKALRAIVRERTRRRAGAMPGRGALFDGRQWSAINPGQDHRRNGAIGLGESEGGATVGADASPDWLCAGETQHSDEEVLSPFEACAWPAATSSCRDAA